MNMLYNKKIVILLILLFIFPKNVFAYGNINISISSVSIEVGSSKSFSITATNSIGDVLISSSDDSILKVNTNEWTTGVVDEGKIISGTITLYGLKPGNAEIYFDIDAATFDEESLSGMQKKISVTVTEKNSKVNNNIEYSDANKSENQSISNNKLSNSSIKIKKFEILGYNIDFNPQKYEYEIDILNNEKYLYLTLEGDDIEVSQQGKINIEKKNKILITVKNNNDSVIYTIKLNRINKKNKMIKLFIILILISLILFIVLKINKFKKDKIMNYLFVICITFLSFDNVIFANNVDNGWHLVKSLPNSKYLTSFYDNGIEYKCPNNNFFTIDRNYDWAYYNNDIEEKRLNRLIVIHGGYGGENSKYYYPHNSLLALKMSKIHGFDANEIDVRFTKDSIPVVVHDECLYENNGYLYMSKNNTYLDNKSNKLKISEDSKVCIRDLTLNQLKNYKFISRYANIISEDLIDKDCQTYFKDEYNNDNDYCKRIPTFEETIDLAFNNKMALNIEIKDKTINDIKKIVDIIKNKKMSSSVRWVSSSDKILREILKNDNSAMVQLLADNYTKDEQKIIYKELKEMGRDNLVSIRLAPEDYNDNNIMGIIVLDINYNNIGNYSSKCFNIPTVNFNPKIYKLKNDKYIVLSANSTYNSVKNELNISNIETKNNNSVVKTGDSIKFAAYNYVAIILGDVDGNGKISLSDYEKVYNYIQKIKHYKLDKDILSGHYLIAADITEDNKIDYLDYVKIYKKSK